MTKRKFYRTVFTVEVLSEEPFGDGVDLVDLKYMINEGDCSGCIRQSDPEELDGLRAARALEKQHSDPGFFRLDEDGNDYD